MSDNNDFMAATVGIIPFLLLFPRIYKGKHATYVKVISYLMLLLSFFAIVFSDSRGAAVGLVGLVFFYLFIVSKRKGRDLLVVGVLGMVVLVALPETFWDRMQSIEFSLKTQSEASASSRLNLMKSAGRCFLDNPVFGIGPNSWLLVAEEYAGTDSEPHSAYLKLAAETGLPGLGIFIFLLIGTIRRLLKNREQLILQNNQEHATFSMMLAWVLVGIAVPFMFLNHPYSEFLWAWLAVANSYLSLKILTNNSAKANGYNS